MICCHWIEAASIDSAAESGNKKCAEQESKDLNLPGTSQQESTSSTMVNLTAKRSFKKNMKHQLKRKCAKVSESGDSEDDSK